METPETEGTISPEAEARKTIDGLKTDLATATEALKAATIHSKLVQTFASQGRTNPFDLATQAQSDFEDVTAETPADDLAARTTAWFDQQAAMFSPGEQTEPQAPPSQPATPLSDVQPNLTSPGLQPQTVPVVVGSKEYYEAGWANRSDAEQIAAMRSGDLVTSDKVKSQQEDTFLQT